MILALSKPQSLESLSNIELFTGPYNDLHTKKSGVIPLDIRVFTECCIALVFISPPGSSINSPRCTYATLSIPIFIRNCRIDSKNISASISPTVPPTSTNTKSNLPSNFKILSITKLVT